MASVQAPTPGTRAAHRPARALRRVAALAPLLVVAGCADLERFATEARDAPPVAFSGGSRHQREMEMNRQWQNRSLSELKAMVGEPQLTMNIPGGGNPPGFVVVYGLDNRSGCIDAFAISTGSMR